MRPWGPSSIRQQNSSGKPLSGAALLSAARQGARRRKELGVSARQADDSSRQFVVEIFELLAEAYA